MFCSKCGVNLPEKAKKCPNCGEPVTGNEYCGGFWGLVNGNKPQAPKATERINTENRNIQASKKDNKPSEREVKMMNNYKKNTRSLLIVSAALAAAVIIEFIVILMFVLGSENDGNIEMTDNSNIAATETDNGNNEFLQPKITQDTTAEKVTTEEYTEETTEKETNGIFKNDKKDEMDFMNETEPESGNTKELFTDSDF